MKIFIVSDINCHTWVAQAGSFFKLASPFFAADTIEDAKRQYLETTAISDDHEPDIRAVDITEVFSKECPEIAAILGGSVSGRIKSFEFDKDGNIPID